MIVENKELTIEKANDISSKLILMISSESKSFVCEDDPAEQIYLGCHILGSLLAKVCISLEGYGQIYGIKNLNKESIMEWINKIANENIGLNK
jgi:hypothetical protein